MWLYRLLALWRCHACGLGRGSPCSQVVESALCSETCAPAAAPTTADACAALPFSMCLKHGDGGEARGSSHAIGGRKKAGAVGKRVLGRKTPGFPDPGKTVQAKVALLCRRPRTSAPRHPLPPFPNSHFACVHECPVEELRLVLRPARACEPAPDLLHSTHGCAANAAQRRYRSGTAQCTPMLITLSLYRLLSIESSHQWWPMGGRQAKHEGLIAGTHACSTHHKHKVAAVINDLHVQIAGSLQRGQDTNGQPCCLLQYVRVRVSVCENVHA